jgi:hypothetical protein
MNFTSLYKELDALMFAQDIEDWFNFRQKEIASLSWKDYKTIIDLARFRIECDYNCC